jgi:hypothetical protein
MTSSLSIPSIIYLALLSLYFVPCTAMSYMALDMRNNEKCVTAFYPEDTRLDVLYEILGKSSEQLTFMK